MAAKCKHLAVWATFAQKEYEKLGYSHVQTIAGTVDPNEFHPISEDRRNSLRKKFGLEDATVFLTVNRSQLRKAFPNTVEAFKKFKDNNSNIKAKLYFHTFYGGEGWDLPKIVQDKGLDPNDVLTTYYCRNCKQWEVKSFYGLDQDCPHCKAEKTYSTCSIVHGVSEENLCDIYGLSDAVISAFNSGGYEYTTWQGKMCEKITFVTEYSCGLDGCHENSGGWPIKWNPYMEVGSCFVKANSCPDSICELMEKFVNLPMGERRELEKRAREFAIEWASTDKVCRRIADYFELLEPANWEGFSFEPVPKNPSHVPPNNLSPEGFAINLLTNMMGEKVDQNTSHVKNWAAHLRKSNDYQGVYKHFVNLALQFNANLNNKPVDLAELLDKDDEGKRICVVMPESAGDLIVVNSLLKQFKFLYPEYNLYFFTKPEFFELIEGHESVHRVLAWAPVFENILFMEGNREHKGYFVAAFYPHAQTQRFMSVHHNTLEHRAEWLS
jgi:glycosyltransferase involved in cell wall biosynthesis